MADTNGTNNKTNTALATKKGGLKKFFREVKSEMKKVTWPSKQQLIHNTLIILIFILITTALLAVLDLGFAKLFAMLTDLF